MPHKFSHIKTLSDIDDEIIRTELKKSIIRNDISLRVSNVREMLKPASLGWQLVKFIFPRNDENSASSVLIKTILEVLTTVEASKFGWKMLKRIFQ